MMKRYIIVLLILGTNICSNIHAQSLEKQANNPLANMTSLNFHNHYAPKLTDAPSDAYMNTTWMRLAIPAVKGKLLFRISAPIVSLGKPYLDGATVDSKNGLGDINAFMSYNFIAEPDKTIGIGPLISAPTATQSALGSGKWQGGLAFVAFFCKSSAFQYGGLVTWQKSFAGSKDRGDAESLSVQPFAMVQLGKGFYMRSSATWYFDFMRDSYSVPLSLGVGKVIKVNNVAFNFFIEPQYAVLHSGTHPQFQLNIGANIQSLKKKK